jgi:hypothetical protein
MIPFLPLFILSSSRDSALSLRNAKLLANEPCQDPFVSLFLTSCVNLSTRCSWDDWNCEVTWKEEDNFRAQCSNPTRSCLFYGGVEVGSICNSSCVNWQLIRGIVITLIVLAAIVVTTMIGCCFFCTRCLFEMPAPFPTVVSSQFQSNYRVSLKEPLQAGDF